MANHLGAAKAFYELLLTDPQKACESHMAQQVELENPLPAHIPFGGVYTGRAGFLKYVSEVFKAIEIEKFDLIEWVAEETTVVVRGYEESLVKSTGRRYGMRWVHWLSFDAQGLITHMREYNDTAEMAAAFERP